MERNKRIGIIIDSDLLSRCDSSVGVDNSQTRSEFISKAIEYYLAFLNKDADSRVLTPALESVIGAKILDTENRLARVMFKQAVELSLLNHLLAGAYEFTPADIEKLRGMCVKEIKKLGGRYDLESVARYQSYSDE